MFNFFKRKSENSIRLTLPYPSIKQQPRSFIFSIEGCEFHYCGSWSYPSDISAWSQKLQVSLKSFDSNASSRRGQGQDYARISLELNIDSEENFLSVFRKPKTCWFVNIYTKIGGGEQKSYNAKVRYLEDLPNEALAILRPLIEACHKEYQDYPARVLREKEQEQKAALLCLGDSLALTSPNQFIRFMSAKIHEISSK